MHPASKTADPPKNSLSGKPALLLLVLPFVLALAFFLRLTGLKDMLIFADEIHTIPIAVHKSLPWILSHFTGNDACIPLTAYNHLLVKTGLLNEFTFRLPCVVTGSLLPLILAWQGKNRDHLHQSAFFFGSALAGLSPYLVYLSREARPYPIAILFFYLSACLVFSWIRKTISLARPAGRKLYLAALCAFLAIYFHPIVAPSTFVLGLATLYPLGLAACQGDKHRVSKLLRTYPGPLGLFCLLFALSFIPAWPSFSAGFSEKIVHGQADLTTFLSGTSLLLAIPEINPWLILGLTVVGTLLLADKYPLECFVLWSMLILQLAILYFLEPRFLEIPWVLFRYLAHLIPFWLLALAWVCVWLLQRLLSPILLEAFVALLIFCLGCYQLVLGHYPLHRVYNTHPMALYLTQQDLDQLLTLPAARFYRTRLGPLKQKLSCQQGLLIESPFLATFPLYGLYHRAHHWTVKTTSLGKYFGRNLCIGNKGVHWNTALDPKKINVPKAQPGAGPGPCPIYLVVHKRIKKELQTAYSLLKKRKPAAMLLAGMDTLFTPHVLQTLFGPGEVALPQELKKALRDQNWKISYQDAYLEVWKVE